jgi:enoyl-CoA hydratase
MSVDVEIRGASMVLTLNRPHAANALDSAMGVGIGVAVREATARPEIRSIVVTGAGDKVFCAGMDLKAFAEGQDMAPVGDGLRRLAECPKPVIAAVNGSAVAGGFEVVMRCDLVVAADHARFGIPEVRRGLVAAGGGTRLPRRIPLAVALELGLTGELITAARAKELGLVNHVVPASDVLDAALGLADRINANGPLAVVATKRLMLEEIGPHDDARVREVVAPVFSSDDAMEGARAFADKREPRWTGR